MPPFVRRTLLAAATLGIAACSSETPTEPATKTDVTLNFCGDAPPWVAYGNEGGAWTEVKGVTSGTAHTYSFKMTPLGGVAFVRTLTCSTHNYVVYGTAAELVALFSGSACGTSGLKTVHGSLAGGFASQYSHVSLGGFGGGGHDNVYGESGNFTLERVPPGPQDFLASRGTSSGTDKVIVRRGVDVNDGATIPLVDFRSTEAVALDSATVSIQESGGNGSVSGSVFSSIYTANGGWATGSFASGNPTARYRGLPTYGMIAGDMHQIAVLAGGRYLDTFMGPISNLTVSLGPVAATPTVSTLAASTPVRMRMSTPVQAEYPKLATGRFWGGTRPYYYVTVEMTAAYRRGAKSWVLEAPNFGTSSGYNAAWGIPAGLYRGWESEVYGWDPFGKFVPSIGLTRRRAGVSSTSAAASALPSLLRLEGRVGRPSPVSAGYEQLACSTQ